MSSSQISLLSPVYNCADHVPALLRNSRDNHGDYFRHLIANDGSTDATSRLIADGTAKREAVTFYDDAENIGPHRRSSFLHEAVESRYIMGLSHDDMIAPGFLRKANRVLQENPGIGLVFGDLLYVDDYGNYLGIARPRQSIAGKLLSGKAFIDGYMVPNGPYHSQDGSTVLDLQKLNSVYCDTALRRAGAMFFDTFNHQLVGIKYGAVHIPEVAHVLKRHRNACSTLDDNNNSEAIRALFKQSIDEVVEQGVLPADLGVHMRSVFE